MAQSSIVISHPHRRRFICLLLGLLSTLQLGGCARVKPYQREYLAERCMSPGFGDAAELKFRAHWEASRQGLAGGYGSQTGGCGCN